MPSFCCFCHRHTREKSLSLGRESRRVERGWVCVNKKVPSIAFVPGNLDLVFGDLLSICPRLGSGDMSANGTGGSQNTWELR